MALTISINMLYRGLPDELGVCRDRQLGRSAGIDMRKDYILQS
jgi:hypothetical protein